MSDVLRNPQGVFAKTRQGSEETLRISHLTHLRLRPRSQQTDFEQARTLVCHYARSPLRGLLAPYGADASIPAPHEPKTCRFCLIPSLSTRRGGCGDGLWDRIGAGYVLWGACMIGGWAGWRCCGWGVYNRQKLWFGIGGKSIREFSTKIIQNPITP